VLVTFLAAGIPAFQAGRISPMEALRVRAKTKEGWLIRRGWIVGIILLAVAITMLVVNPFPYDVQFSLGSLTIFGLFGGATLMIPATVSIWERITRPLVRWLYGNVGGLGSRNIRRSRQRTTLTVAALMVGVAMVIMTRGITTSFKSDLMIWIESYLGGDILVSSSIPLRSDLATRIKSVNGVAAITPIRYFDAKWLAPDGEDVSISFRGLDPATYVEVTSFVFSDVNTDAESVVQQLKQGEVVLISSTISERYNLDPGDSVRLRTNSGVHAFKVAAVVIDYYNQGLSMQVSWNDMRRYFRINDSTVFMVKVDNEASTAEVQQQIDELYKQRYQLILESNLSLRQRTQSLVDKIFSFFDVTSLIAVVVASLGVVNTLTMSVLERMQEIGMLRAIGMTRAQVVKMVLAEAGLIGIIGDVLGMVTGIVLGQVLVIGMGTMTGYEISFSLPTGDLLVSVAAALLISQLAAIFPARRAARVRILEAVQYE
jgi:putative ABC transport system permease protein